MGATSKRAKKIRPSSEFDLMRIAAEMQAPKVNSGFYGWTLERIRAARDAQMIGNFLEAARLAEATRTDYAIFASFLNRLAPQHGLPVEMVAANETARAVRIRDEADALFGPKGIGIQPDTLSDIDGTLANHGVAFAVNVVTPRPDGSRVDFELKSWPIEHVRWNQAYQSFETRTINTARETICHGDGRWVVFQQHDYEPWKYGALLPVGLLWGDHAFGIRDRSKAATTHGNAKPIGTMPQGMALTDAKGLTPQAAAFLQVLRDLVSPDSTVGIKPFGSVVDMIVNDGTAWQIFKEIIDGGDRAADRIYLGTPALAPAAGGDSVGYLFGVRDDIVEGSLGAIERGIRTGTIEPWCAVNHGDSALAPTRRYLMPDADEDARRKSIGDRTKAFFDAIESAAKRFTLTQAYVNDLAKDYGVRAPILKASTPDPTSVGAPPGTPPPAPGAAPPPPSGQ